MAVRLAAALAACAMLAVAGCGGDTGVTIINQTTTNVGGATTAASTGLQTTTVAPASPTVTTGGGNARADETTTNTNSKQYSGPCGEPSTVVGGTPPTAGTPATPGYTELEADGVGCDFAAQVASGWIAAWDAQCAPGCTRQLADMRCTYAGSGSHVQCFGKEEAVRFLLSFPSA